jgi:hypothetical protein
LTPIHPSISHRTLYTGTLGRHLRTQRSCADGGGNMQVQHRLGHAPGERRPSAQDSVPTSRRVSLAGEAAASTDADQAVLQLNGPVDSASMEGALAALNSSIKEQLAVRTRPALMALRLRVLCHVSIGCGPEVEFPLDSTLRCWVVTGC